MQKIEYVERGLLEWGEWVIRQIDCGGVGNVVSSIYSGRPIVQTSGDAQASVHELSEWARWDAMVVRLASVDPLLFQAVREVYVDGRRWSMTINARRMRISRNALHERVCRAQLMIDTWLRDKPDRKNNFAGNTDLA